MKDDIFAHVVSADNPKKIHIYSSAIMDVLCNRTASAWAEVPVTRKTYCKSCENAYDNICKILNAIMEAKQ